MKKRGKKKTARKASERARPAAKPRASGPRRPALSEPDWRSAMLDRVRTLTARADPDAVEEVKWRKPSNAMQGVPVWSHDGLLFTGETYKDKVKLTFAKGAALEDPSGLFNAGLEGGTRRAIDLFEGDTLDERAFGALVRAAAGHNAASKPVRSRGARGKK